MTNDGRNIAVTCVTLLINCFKLPIVRNPGNSFTSLETIWVKVYLSLSLPFYCLFHHYKNSHSIYLETLIREGVEKLSQQ